MNKFKLGIIGTGLISAGSHLPAALGLPDIEVNALVDPVRDRSTSLARKYGISPQIVQDVREVLGMLDGVIIATPNSTHCEIALACIEAGVHVLIEKPLANTVDEGNAIMENATRKGVVVATGFCTRFRSNVLLLKELLDDEYFGRIQRFAHQFGTAGGWAPLSAYNLSKQEAGGGVLVVSGSHFLDRMLYFWGFPVSASLTHDGFNGPEANCTAHFQFAGFQGIARYSKTTNLRTGLNVETDRGFIVLGDSDESQIKFIPQHRSGVCETISLSGKKKQQADVFQLQIMDFVAACRNRTLPRVDVQQGVNSLRLVEMLYANSSVALENWYE